MSIFGSIATYIEFRAEDAGLDCLGFYNKGTFGVFGHFEISLAF